MFGFALTLLVVSLDAPRTFDELAMVVRGFLPFAVTFALVAWILIVAIGGDGAAAWSGISYALLGPVHGMVGAALGSRRARLQAQADDEAVA